jgi:anaerobic ribonucleoside-triphosphate reductase
MTNLSEQQHFTRPAVLDDSRRTRCEVWTRVMGYHRPVASFNTGKQGEFQERLFFRECKSS